MSNSQPASSFKDALSKGTPVTIGVALAVSVALLAAQSWLGTQLQGIRSELVELRYQVTRIEDREATFKEGFQANRWRRSDQLQWAADLQAKNPELKIPRVEAP